MTLVAATPYGRGDGSSRVRVHEWVDQLGLPVELLVAMPDGRPGGVAGWTSMAVQAGHALRVASTVRRSTVWVHREVSPLSPGVIESALLRRGAPAVFDLDDALYEEPMLSARSLLLRRRAKAELCARRADLVIAGNPAIADWASSLGAEAVVVPSCVEPGRYRRKSEYEVDGAATLVWVGSSGTLPHLRAVLPALEEVRRRRDLELVVIGPALASRAEGDPWPAWVSLLPWSEETVQRELARMDVGIMPLPDRPYERGKCAYKLLQYGAAGLPVVGSPVGVNSSILASMGAPAPVDQAGWVDALDALLAMSEGERRALGQQAAAVVAAEFSFERWRPEMKRLLGAG